MFNQQSSALTQTMLKLAPRRMVSGAFHTDARTLAPLSDQFGENGIQHSVEHNNTDASQTIPIMEWWKLKPVAEVLPHDLPRLKRCIRGFEIIGDLRWRAAEASDVSAAIAVAIRLVKQGLIATPVMNLAGTALLIAAVKGDATAKLMIEYLAGLKTAVCLEQYQNQSAATVHQLQQLIAAEMEACS